MTHRSLHHHSPRFVLAVCLSLFGCGGNTSSISSSQSPMAPPISSTTAMMSAPATDAINLSGLRNRYSLRRAGSMYYVSDLNDNSTQSYSNIAKFNFSDMSVNLKIVDLLPQLSEAQLQSLIELYIAFFNRTPDADGMVYWMSELIAGRSITNIAESFYEVGRLYPELTGYSANMSSADFIRIVYKNVLGRTGDTAPSNTEVNYWANQLDLGTQSRSNIINTMLVSARTFANDPTYGWVTTLLNNKISLGKFVAIDQGITYLSNQDNISISMATIAAVSATDTSLALAKLALKDTQFSLSSTGTGNTLGVHCQVSYSAYNASSKVLANSIYSWACANNLRTLSANGIPDHAVIDGNFATPISAQVLNVNIPLAPVLSSGQTSAVGLIGYALNGVKFDPATAGTCKSSATGTGNGSGCVMVAGQDPWKIEAIGGAFVFGVDSNNAHVQPNGQYHYHGLPEGIINKLDKGKAMTLVGFAKDGFPIYARYGFTIANDSTSGVRLMLPSYVKKSTPDAGRPSTSIFPMGTFTQDFAYQAGAGDLDDCNGRYGVTPEFPKGIYHYYVTESFPYVQRCVKGNL